MFVRLLLFKGPPIQMLHILLLLCTKRWGSLMLTFIRPIVGPVLLLSLTVRASKPALEFLDSQREMTISRAALLEMTSWQHWRLTEEQRDLLHLWRSAILLFSCILSKKYLNSIQLTMLIVRAAILNLGFVSRGANNKWCHSRRLSDSWAYSGLWQFSFLGQCSLGNTTSRTRATT